MMLDSHDLLFCDITPTGMTLQLRQASEEGAAGTAAQQAFEDSAADTVVLNGRDVALLLYRLTTANADGLVVIGGADTPKLSVKTAHSGPGPILTTIRLESDANTVKLQSYERDMLVAAIRSRVWRMFT